jgi:hypothetical protein
MVQVIVDGLADDLAMFANSHGDAAQRKMATGRGHTREITAMGSSGNPLRAHLVATHHPVRYCQLEIAYSSQSGTFTSHNRSPPNQQFRVHPILNNGVFGVIML